MDDKTSKALFERLQRMEARLVRGFTEMGVVVCDDDEWIRIDHERREVRMKGAGRSIKAIQLAIHNSPGYIGGNYAVLVAGHKVATVEMSDD